MLPGMGKRNPVTELGKGLMGCGCALIMLGLIGTVGFIVFMFMAAQR
jgi:hypothetical protein